MRPDLDKVITERPRHGHSNPSAKTGCTVSWDGPDGDYGFPCRISSARARQYGYEAKTFSDLLGPLYRWIAKQVGRPWNHVYSELSGAFDKGKTTHRHIFVHIFQFVERSVVNHADGTWISAHRVRREFLSPPPFYVHPATGLLCKNREAKRWRHERSQEPSPLPAGDGKVYERIDGLWYIVKKEKRRLAIQPPATWHQNPWEEVIVFKKQANKKEIKRVHELLRSATPACRRAGRSISGTRLAKASPLSFSISNSGAL